MLLRSLQVRAMRRQFEPLDGACARAKPRRGKLPSRTRPLQSTRGVNLDLEMTVVRCLERTRRESGRKGPGFVNSF